MVLSSLRAQWALEKLILCFTKAHCARNDESTVGVDMHQDEQCPCRIHPPLMAPADRVEERNR